MTSLAPTPLPPSSIGVTPLLSLLSEPSPPVVHAALLKIHSLIPYGWHEISSSVAQIEGLGEKWGAGQSLSDESRAVARAIASKVFYHLSDLSSSLRLALTLLNTPFFDVVNDSSAYVKAVTWEAISYYVKERSRPDAGDEDDNNGDDDEAMDGKKSSKEFMGHVEKVVDLMFERCFKNASYNNSMGIALSSLHLPRVQQILTHCSLNNSALLPPLLTYTLISVVEQVTNRAFRLSVVRCVSDSFSNISGLPYGQERLKCHHLLSDAAAVASAFKELVASSSTDDDLLAYQLCFDLVDTGDQAFITNVTEAFKGLRGESKENEQAWRKCLEVLEGGFTGKLELAFLFGEADIDPLIMRNMKKELESKLARSSSLLHSMSINAHALLTYGTTQDVFLRENLEYLKKANHWSQFSATASLGVVHCGHVEEAMTLLEPYLPADGVVVGVNEGFAEGGALYALGLVHCKATLSTEIRKTTTEYLREKLRSSMNNEIMSHGAALGVGLSAMGTHSTSLYNELKDLLYMDSAVSGEAAGIAMGLVMVGAGGSSSVNEQNVTEMLSYAKDTTHEKIIRGLSMGVALTYYGCEDGADTVIEQMSRDRDPILRYGAMYTIALAYCGTGSNKAVRQLLHVAVSDVSNDVRMASIIGIAFVLFKTPERVPNLVRLLLESFNPHVRYASCMAVGIALSSTGNQEAIDCLEVMLDDNVDYVKQGALIGLSMIMMQQPDGKQTKKFREKLSNVVKEKHHSQLTKMGAILGIGILDAGGRNVSLSMQSRAGFTKQRSAVGLALFAQHWYWHPLTHMISLSFSPSIVCGLNANFEFPKGFEIHCDSVPSAFAYPKRLEEKKEEAKKRVTTVTLSTTAKTKAKLAAKKKAEGESMEVDAAEESADAPSSDDKEVKENEADEKDGKKKTVKKAEPKHFRLKNPNRMSLSQVDVSKFDLEQRYRPVLTDSKAVGIVILTDSTPEEPEEATKVLSPALQTDEEPLPGPFVWTPAP